jgi:tRNA threonylcarbamoyl adenosine modification protein YjeE
MKERVFGKDGIEAVAREVLERLSAMPRTRASVLALSGDLGAGKTTLTQAIARILKVEPVVTSPTFVIEKSYPLSGAPWERLIHIDAYRIDDDSELAVLGFAASCDDPRNLIVLEWPERVSGLVPHDALGVTLVHNGEDERILRYA